MTDLSTIPPEFSPASFDFGYASSLGDIWLRQRPSPAMGCLFAERHLNINGVVHGGALATLADTGLFIIAGEDGELVRGATLSLDLKYLAPVEKGSFVHCAGRTIRKGKSIIFAEGSLFAGEEEKLRFAGVIKRFR